MNTKKLLVEFSLLTLCIFLFSLSGYAFQQDYNEIFDLDGKLEKTLDVSEGGFLKIKNVSGDIIINSIPEKKYTLDELLLGVNEKNIHNEFDTGKAIGREVW